MRTLSSSLDVHMTIFAFVTGSTKGLNTDLQHRQHTAEDRQLHISWGQRACWGSSPEQAEESRCIKRHEVRQALHIVGTRQV